jgi:hypothetical protein
MASIVGTPGNDNLAGTPGQDFIDGRGGADVIDGGAGFDLVSYADPDAAAAILLDFSDPALNTGEAALDALYTRAELLELISASLPKPSRDVLTGIGDDCDDLFDSRVGRSVDQLGEQGTSKPFTGGRRTQVNRILHRVAVGLFLLPRCDESVAEHLTRRGFRHDERHIEFLQVREFLTPLRECHRVFVERDDAVLDVVVVNLSHVRQVLRDLVTLGELVDALP